MCQAWLHTDAFVLIGVFKQGVKKNCACKLYQESIISLLKNMYSDINTLFLVAWDMVTVMFIFSSDLIFCYS